MFTPFLALVRKDIKLYLQRPARPDHEPRRSHRHRLVLRLHFRRTAAQPKPAAFPSWPSTRTPAQFPARLSAA